MYKFNAATKECIKFNLRTAFELTIFFPGPSYIFFDSANVFLCGGYIKFKENWLGEECKSCCILNFGSSAMLIQTNMTEGRCSHACHYANDRIYVFGGFMKNSAEIFEIRQNTWELMQSKIPFPEMSDYYNVVSFNQWLYISADGHNEIAKFDIATQTFYLLSYSLPTTRPIGLTTDQEHLYIFIRSEDETQTQIIEMGRDEEILSYHDSDLRLDTIRVQPVYSDGKLFTKHYDRKHERLGVCSFDFQSKVIQLWIEDLRVLD